MFQQTKSCPLYKKVYRWSVKHLQMCPPPCQTCSYPSSCRMRLSESLMGQASLLACCHRACKPSCKPYSPRLQDDSCTWSPEHLQMAVGCLPEELQDWASKADADRQQQATEADEGQQQAGDAPQAAAEEGANDPAQPTWIARHPLKLRSAYNEVRFWRK